MRNKIKRCSATGFKDGDLVKFKAEGRPLLIVKRVEKLGIWVEDYFPNGIANRDLILILMEGKNFCKGDGLEGRIK